MLNCFLQNEHSKVFSQLTYSDLGKIKDITDVESHELGGSELLKLTFRDVAKELDGFLFHLFKVI